MGKLQLLDWLCRRTCVASWCLKALGKTRTALRLSCAAVAAFTRCDNPQFYILPMAVLNVDTVPLVFLALPMARLTLAHHLILNLTGNCFSFWGLLGCLLISSRNSLAPLLSNPSSPGSEQTSEDIRVIYMNSGLFKQCSVHKCWLWKAVLPCQKHSCSLFSLILFLPLAQVVI